MVRRAARRAGRALREMTRGRLAVLLTRYTVGSVVAGVISELVFLVAYGPGGAGPRVASVAAFVAGAVPNYVLNRAWAWERRGRDGLGREIASYGTIAVTTAALAAVITSVADAQVHRLVAARPAQVVLVGMAFLVTYAVMFVVKFILFDRLVFARRTRPRTPRQRVRESAGH